MQAEGDFFIPGSVGRLNARFDLPTLPEGEKCPLVICCHGFGGTLDFHLWPPLAARLNEHGIGVLRFDFNGCGKSDGEFQHMTVGNEVDDALNVIAYARDLAKFSSISLVGHSQGGVVAGMAAGRCGGAQIRSLVLMSAAAVLRAMRCGAPRRAQSMTLGTSTSPFTRYRAGASRSAAPTSRTP